MSIVERKKTRKIELINETDIGFLFPLLSKWIVQIPALEWPD